MADHDKGHLTITRGARLAAIGLLFLVMVMGAANLWATYDQVRASEQKWCQTVDLLTSHRVPKPADPVANPSRMEDYILYSDFVTLRHQLGCG